MVPKISLWTYLLFLAIPLGVQCITKTFDINNIKSRWNDLPLKFEPATIQFKDGEIGFFSVHWNPTDSSITAKSSPKFSPKENLKYRITTIDSNGYEVLSEPKMLPRGGESHPVRNDVTTPAECWIEIFKSDPTLDVSGDEEEAEETDNANIEGADDASLEVQEGSKDSVGDVDNWKRPDLEVPLLPRRKQAGSG